jgi:AbrB family looped-hinge helix DNA binding protein
MTSEENESIDEDTQMLATTKLDSKGRVTLPRSIQLEMGITPGREVEVRVVEDRLEVRLVPRPLLTADLVRKTLESVRRSRRPGLESS